MWLGAVWDKSWQLWKMCSKIFDSQFKTVVQDFQRHIYCVTGGDHRQHNPDLIWNARSSEWLLHQTIRSEGVCKVQSIYWLGLHFVIKKKKAQTETEVKVMRSFVSDSSMHIISPSEFSVPILFLNVIQRKDSLDKNLSTDMALPILWCVRIPHYQYHVLKPYNHRTGF